MRGGDFCPLTHARHPRFEFPAAPFRGIIDSTRAYLASKRRPSLLAAVGPHQEYPFMFSVRLLSRVARRPARSPHAGTNRRRGPRVTLSLQTLEDRTQPATLLDPGFEAPVLGAGQ